MERAERNEDDFSHDEHRGGCLAFASMADRLQAEPLSSTFAPGFLLRRTSDSPARHDHKTRSAWLQRTTA